jgi:diacylglycerol kinase family enzyme
MKTVLLIVNAHAGSVSARTREVIAKALAADFKLEVVETAARDHGSELARDAVDRGFDAVLAFGGDGTINEVVQPLVGTDVALGVLPGGSTNVLARALGVPRDPVEATAFTASRLNTETKRRINVGRMNERFFIFSAGLGLDADVVRRVETDPDAKREHGELFFLTSALNVAFKEYRGRRPEMTISVDGGEPEHVIQVVCCNGRPFTFFGRFPVDVCPEARLDGGLDTFSLTKISTLTIPRIAWGLLVSRSHPRWRNARYHHDARHIVVVPAEPTSVQVDGDFIGQVDRAELTLVEDALDLLV